MKITFNAPVSENGKYLQHKKKLTLQTCSKYINCIRHLLKTPSGLSYWIKSINRLTMTRTTWKSISQARHRFCEAIPHKLIRKLGWEKRQSNNIHFERQAKLWTETNKTAQLWAKLCWWKCSLWKRSNYSEIFDTFHLECFQSLEIFYLDQSLSIRFRQSNSNDTKNSKYYPLFSNESRCIDMT